MRHCCMIGSVACFFLLSVCPFEATAKEDFPNFVVVLSDDQSWVGSSVMMDPEDPETRQRLLSHPADGTDVTDGDSIYPRLCPSTLLLPNPTQFGGGADARQARLPERPARLDDSIP